MIFSLVFPAETAASVRDGLLLCAEKVIPSLFMFICAARLLAKSGIERIFEKCKLLLAIFGVSPAGMTVIFIGFICGYPSGSSTAAELCKSGRMTAEEASSLLPFTNCAGAAFLIGAVGSSMLGDTKAGVVLFITQSVTSALLLILTAPRRRACLARAFPPPPSENSKPTRVSGVAGAVASAVAEGGAALDRLLELAEQYGMDVETVTDETRLPFGDGELTIFPPVGVSGSNELGLTVLASAGEHSFLITGDMERATEKKLIETYELPELDVLMAGHHGSKNSTSKELLDAVTPGTVIISVGSNSYGHPAEDTLRRLARAGCDIYRTDRHGTVYLSFD